MKSFVAGVFLFFSIGAHAEAFSVAEKNAFFAEMPSMLREYSGDEAINACIEKARLGDDRSFSALVVIAHAKKAIDEHTSSMSEAVSGSTSKDELYKRSKAVYQSKNLRENMQLLLGMPKAIKHCNALVNGGVQ